MNEQLVPGSVLRGSRVVSGDIRPNPRWNTGRICGQTGCTTVLSIYNREGLCFAHSPTRYEPLRASRRRPAA